jgi:hypothetical protein
MMPDHRSRYALVENTTWDPGDGHLSVHKRRRFLPREEDIPLLSLVSIAPGDRLDRITASTLGDPEQFWQICDANNCMNPYQEPE